MDNSNALKCDFTGFPVMLAHRVGINSGEVVHREGNRPFGQAVVMASRILSKCKGGDILISDITRQLTAGSKFSYIEREPFKAKGFNEEVKLFEVVQTK